MATPEKKTHTTPGPKIPQHLKQRLKTQHGYTDDDIELIEQRALEFSIEWPRTNGEYHFSSQLIDGCSGKPCPALTIRWFKSSDRFRPDFTYRWIKPTEVESQVTAVENKDIENRIETERSEGPEKQEHQQRLWKDTSPPGNELQQTSRGTEKSSSTTKEAPVNTTTSDAAHETAPTHLYRRIYALTNRCIELVDQLTKAENEIEQYKNRVIVRTKHLEDAKAKITRLKDENNNLNSEIRKLQENETKLKDVSDRLWGQLSTLNRSFREKGREMANHTFETLELQEKIEKLEGQLAASPASKISILEESVRDLRESEQQLKEERKVYMKEITRLQVLIQKPEKDLSAIREESAQLSDRVEWLKVEIKNQSRHLETLKLQGPDESVVAREWKYLAWALMIFILGTVRPKE